MKVKLQVSAYAPQTFTDCEGIILMFFESVVNRDNQNNHNAVPADSNLNEPATAIQRNRVRFAHQVLPLITIVRRTFMCVTL